MITAALPAGKQGRSSIHALPVPRFMDSALACLFLDSCLACPSIHGQLAGQTLDSWILLCPARASIHAWPAPLFITALIARQTLDSRILYCPAYFEHFGDFEDFKYFKLFEQFSILQCTLLSLAKMMTKNFNFTVHTALMK